MSHEWPVKDAMQRIVTIYESFRNTIWQKISKLTSKLLSFSEKPRSRIYRLDFAELFIHVCSICSLSLRKSSEKQVGRFTFHSVMLVTWIWCSDFHSEDTPSLCWPLLRLQHTSQHISWSPTLTHKIVCIHVWMAGLLLIILACCHVLTSYHGPDLGLQIQSNLY